MLLHRKLPLSLALLGLVLSAPRAEANGVYLDDFTASPVSLTCSPNCISVQLGIPTANVLAGQRVTSTTNAAFSIGFGALDYEGGNGGSFLANYAFTGPTDLTLLGNSFVFNVDVADGVTNPFEITVSDGSLTSSLVPPFTPVVGLNEIPFAAFAGIDFTKIEQVQFGLTNDNAHLRLGAMQVPEPSTAGMFLLGLFGLARIGRSRKSLAA